MCLFLQGVIRKYGRKAHTSGLLRDINVCGSFPQSRRLQKDLGQSRARVSPVQGACPRIKGACPALAAKHAPPCGLCYIASKDQGKPCD